MAFTAPTLGAVSVISSASTPTGMTAGGNTGIGIGSTVHSKKVEKGFDSAPLGILTGPIGQSQVSQALYAMPTPLVALGAAKVTRYMAVGSSDVADGALIATGWVNRSGQTMRAGENAIGVAA